MIPTIRIIAPPGTVLTPQVRQQLAADFLRQQFQEDLAVAQAAGAEAEARREPLAVTGWDIEVQRGVHVRYPLFPKLQGLMNVSASSHAHVDKGAWKDLEEAMRDYRPTLRLPVWKWLQRQCRSRVTPSLRLGPIQIENEYGGRSAKIIPVLNFEDQAEAALFRLTWL